jgi:hypothetical protein
MLTITRGLAWSVDHSVYDDVEQTIVSDLSGYTFKCQIREKVALNSTYPLLIDVNVTITEFGFNLSLTEQQTNDLPWGYYLIDVVATDGYILMPKEAVNVVGHVTLPVDPDDIPDFSQTFLDELD